MHIYTHNINIICFHCMCIYVYVYIHICIYFLKFIYVKPL